MRSLFSSWSSAAWRKLGSRCKKVFHLLICWKKNLEECSKFTNRMYFRNKRIKKQIRQLFFFCLVTISRSLRCVSFPLFHVLWWHLKSLYWYGQQCTWQSGWFWSSTFGKEPKDTGLVDFFPHPSVFFRAVAYLNVDFVEVPSAKSPCLAGTLMLLSLC